MDQAKPNNRGSVLFIDDESDITNAWSDILSNLGYKVTALNDSCAALAAFESDPSAFDVIVTDHMMPGMTGEVLTSRIHEIRPDVPAIMITGFSTTVTQDNFRDFGIREFIKKPFTPDLLDSAIRRALSSV